MRTALASASRPSRALLLVLLIVVTSTSVSAKKGSPVYYAMANLAAGSLPSSLQVDVPAIVRNTFQYPVDATTSEQKSNALITEPFGPSLRSSVKNFNLGLKFSLPRHSPVYATAAGIVQDVWLEGQAGSTFPNGGNVVVLRHTLSAPISLHGITTSTVYSLYLHLQTIDNAVKIGSSLTKGARVGTVGDSGSATSPTLHFEIRAATLCSLPWQLSHSSSPCASYLFDPHVNPFMFLPRTVTGSSFDNILNADKAGIGLDIFDNSGTCDTVTFTVNRNVLSLNRIVLAGGDPTLMSPGNVVIDFNLRTGFNATTDALRDSFTSMSQWGGQLSPESFNTGSSIYRIGITVPPEHRFRLRTVVFYDTFGNGVSATRPAADAASCPIPPSDISPPTSVGECPNYYDVTALCSHTTDSIFNFLAGRMGFKNSNRFRLISETACTGDPPKRDIRFRVIGATPEQVGVIDNVPQDQLQAAGIVGSGLQAAPPIAAAETEDEEKPWWWYAIALAAGMLLILIASIIIARRSLQRLEYGAKSTPSFFDSSKNSRRFDVIGQLDREGDERKALTKQKAEEANALGDVDDMEHVNRPQAKTKRARVVESEPDPTLI